MAPEGGVGSRVPMGRRARARRWALAPRLQVGGGFGKHRKMPCGPGGCGNTPSWCGFGGEGGGGNRGHGLLPRLLRGERPGAK